MPKQDQAARGADLGNGFKVGYRQLVKILDLNRKGVDCSFDMP